MVGIRRERCRSAAVEERLLAVDLGAGLVNLRLDMAVLRTFSRENSSIGLIGSGVVKIRSCRWLQFAVPVGKRHRLPGKVPRKLPPCRHFC